jgi:small subunit ribosomal protein S7
MSRRNAAVQREVLPDAKYNNHLVSKFINQIMVDGQKSKAERKFYSALERLAEQTGEDPISALMAVMENVQPNIEVKSRRVGGATYQVPVEIKSRRRVALAMRWIIGAARSRKNARHFEEKLFLEFVDAYNNKGTAVKKKDDTHKMAEANRAFAHYRW